MIIAKKLTTAASEKIMPISPHLFSGSCERSAGAIGSGGTYGAAHGVFGTLPYGLL